MIFSLPFHIPRFFRPNVLDVFQLTNAQLGDIFAMYGVIALLSYFPGGALADRFSARSLMTMSLVATALGGAYLCTLPGLVGLYMVFAYWGMTSILLFWAALIKATRDWGSEHTQGVAFGVLDGGRGLVASLLASVAVVILGTRLAAGESNAEALQWVIIYYSCATLCVAALVWFTLPGSSLSVTPSEIDERPHWRRVVSERSAWLQAGIVVCAYCGYKSLDNYGVYAVEVLDMSQVEAATLTTYASYSRPLAAIAAGLWADRWRSSKLVGLMFAVAGLAFFMLGQDVAMRMSSLVLLCNVLITFVAVYALRGIYFSLIEEAQVDRAITGSAVGLISLLGFTPDIFFAAIAGRVLDANPGLVGFQHYFIMLSAISILGMLLTLALSRRLLLQQRLKPR